MTPMPKALSAAIKKLQTPTITTPEQKALAERKVRRAKVALSSCPQFRQAVGVIATIRHHFDDSVPTAATDGLNCWWNPTWVLSMNPKQIACVYIHEVGHVLMLHNATAIRLKQHNASAAAAAIDHVVNNWIEDCDPTHAVIEWPTDADGNMFGTFDRQFQRQSAIQVFRELLKNGKHGGGNGGFDQHDFIQLSDEERNEVDKAIEYGKQAMGRGHAGADRESDLTAQDRSTKNYLSYLSQWLYGQMGKGGQLANWKRPNSKLAYRGIYLPSRKGRSLRRFVMTIDTSGSMGNEEVSQAIAISKTIVKQFGCDEMHLIYWDDGVASHEVYKLLTNERTLNKTKPAGGGGTSFAPVLRYIEAHGIKPDVMVTVTDGFVAGWGEKPKFPTLFLVTAGGQPAPYGQTMKV